MEGISKEVLLKEILELEDFTEIKFGITDIDGNIEFLRLARCDGRFLFEMRDKNGIPISHVITLAKK